jgi:hypothetical protein
MIIIDFQQIMIANLSVQLGNHQNALLNEGMLRGMVLNSIRAIRQKFPNHGEVVIACDSRRSWRKDVFPYYKANRAVNRAKSELDWNLIFESFSTITAELKAFFPYRVVQVEGAEADDVIGTLVQEFGTDMIMGFDIEPIIIVSGDKDFKQLQEFSNVTQWDHVKKRMLQCNNPKEFLKEHIIRGDAGDGVPNFLSDDDTLVVSKKRQKQIRETKFDGYMKEYPSNPASETLLRNWKRNEQLVDLRFIPDDIRKQILEQYELEAGKDRSKLVNYFISKKLKNLHSFINEF